MDNERSVNIQTIDKSISFLCSSKCPVVYNLILKPTNRRYFEMSIFPPMEVSIRWNRNANF